MNNIINDCIQEHIDLIRNIASTEYVSQVEELAGQLILTLEKGNTVFWCGNGGSAADALHFSAELVGRFHRKRRALKSISLSADTAALTCISNDFDYQEIFSRQLEALALHGDLLVFLSTSGESKNQLHAANTAKRMGLHTYAVLGKGGGSLANLVTSRLIIPSNTTARVQEAQSLICHMACEIIDEYYCTKEAGK